MKLVTRHSYPRLLVGLLLFLLISPVTDQYAHRLTAMIVDITVLLPIVLGVWSLKRGTRWFVSGLVLMAIIVVLQFANIAVLDRGLATLVHTLTVGFFAGMGLIALEDVLFGGPIDANRLMGAVCVYLLFGIAWGISFALLDTATAEAAFTSIERDLADGGVNEYIYFSFVTMTTLGYGDVAPITPLTRALAFLEATFGQLYLTILVAALVGMLLSREPRGAKRAPDQDETAVAR